MDLLCRRRAAGQEWIDECSIAEPEVAATLRDQARVNRWLGGASLALQHALPVLRSCPCAPVRVLDLACGGADIPRRLVQIARRERRDLAVVGLDRGAGVIKCARRCCRAYPEISLVQADALSPPFSRGTFDLVLLTTFLHHLSPDQVVAVLTTAAGLSRQAVVVTDLVRSPWAAAGFRLLGPLTGLHRVSRHDGTVSIRRAYTAAELAALAQEADLAGATVFRHGVHRMALVYDLRPWQ